MTLAEALAELRRIQTEQDGDAEMEHIYADELISKFLRELGEEGEQLADLWDTMRAWYA